MKPHMVHRESETVIGMADGFREGEHDAIGKLWHDFMPRSGEVQNAKPGYRVGVCFDKHPEVNLDPGETFVYMAAAPVTSLGAVPQGMVAFSVPAQKYAVFTHKGALDSVEETVKHIWGTWAPSNPGVAKKDAPLIEIYDERFKLNSSDSEFDILVPVVED